jgi:hypothetical protein
MENKQRILFNTSDVLSKTAAFHHILRVVGAMGHSFEPFIPQVLPLLQQHMSFSHARVLRKYALKTLQFILIAKKPSGNQALFNQLFDQFSLHILSTASKEGGLKDLKLYFKELFHCMRVMKDNNDGVLFESAAKFETFGKLMEKCLQNVTEQKKVYMEEIEEKQSKAEIDAEDLEAIQTSIYKITGTATYIGECCDIIMSVYKKDSTTVMDTCIKPYYASVMTQYEVVSPQEIQDATFFFINFVKECEIKDQMMVYQVCCQFI